MSDPESGSTLMEIPKVLADADFRRMKLERCKDPTVVVFWRKEAEKAGGEAALANVVPYVTSKLTSFISNDTMRPIIGQQKSSFNLRDIMDRKKILLVDLSKGRVGEMNAYLLGMILVGKILMSALSRTDIPQEQRKDFYLYIDEFQNFTTDSICSILSEARKYNLNLIIAHQYLGQLVAHGKDTTIRDAVFGNVGTWILFKIGSEDAEVMDKEFAPVFNKYDLINIERYTAYVKLLIDNTASRPFSMATDWPLPGAYNPETANKIKSLSRLKYGQDRNVIEAEIMRRARLG
ncbi:MAG: TraM recognition domain-containing protein, partial [Candidatus Methanoperedens sp.]|nr:TraM recognition domain-containing protein [Candidatus Methanoperedens sp.]